MNTRPIDVEDKHGNKVPAVIATCPECDGDSFHIIVVGGHNHLQCTDCGTSFCQGQCDHAPENAQVN